MLVGYGIIVLLTSLGFNSLLGGRPLYGGALSDLAAGMFVAIISGLAGGYLAGMIGASRGLFNAALVLLPLTIDSIYVLFFFKSTVPFWFDAAASATLMFCTVSGGLLREKIMSIGRLPVPP